MNLPHPQLPQTGRISRAFPAVSGKVGCFLKKHPILILALTGLAAFVSKASAQSPLESAKLAEAAVAHLPKPEDPVVLPTDAEMEAYIKNMRESKLQLLQRDPDGWDDLEVSIWKSRDQNYKFDPNDKTKDTDGDGMSDYDEMLVNRDATFAEPFLTEEQQIAQVREGRRQAIAAEKEAVVLAFKRREELAPLIIPPLTTEHGTPATLETVEGEGQQKLATLAVDNVAIDAAKTQRADAFAQRTNIDKHVLEADGRVSSLVDVVDGIPRFYSTNNTVSADTISTDEVRSGGSIGLSLDGSGTTIGVWDGGDVLMPHNEFANGGQRITDKDGTSALGVQFHPTHVSGTMMAKGIVASAKGMASAALLNAYDWTNDLSEMTTAASTDSLRLSNHSYGFKQGWDTITAGGITYWAWYGDTTISGTEDYLFAFYSNESKSSDILAYNAPNYLMVWAAGNERKAASVENGPAAQPVNHYAYNGTSYIWTTGVTRPVDGAGVGYDLLKHQGVAKNTMTVAAVGDIVGGWTSALGVAAADFSSFGPPDDGRVKPDIAANGVGLYSAWDNTSANPGTTIDTIGGYRYTSISGTSMAAPSVTGSLDLLVQHYKNVVGATAPFRAATLKGLATHTADEAGPAAGPD
ncbi:MAG: PII-type proteinase [Verrucomicrobiales bacterium]|nr:PII-type proteinase [Verrucomicrobiales bacterium]